MNEHARDILNSNSGMGNKRSVMRGGLLTFNFYTETYNRILDFFLSDVYGDYIQDAKKGTSPPEDIYACGHSYCAGKCLLNGIPVQKIRVIIEVRERRLGSDDGMYIHPPRDFQRTIYKTALIPIAFDVIVDDEYGSEKYPSYECVYPCPPKIYVECMDKALQYIDFASLDDVGEITFTFTDEETESAMVQKMRDAVGALRANKINVWCHTFMALQLALISLKHCAPTKVAIGTLGTCGEFDMINLPREWIECMEELCVRGTLRVLPAAIFNFDELKTLSLFPDDKHGITLTEELSWISEIRSAGGMNMFRKIHIPKWWGERQLRGFHDIIIARSFTVRQGRRIGKEKLFRAFIFMISERHFEEGLSVMWPDEKKKEYRESDAVQTRAKEITDAVMSVTDECIDNEILLWDFSGVVGKYNPQQMIENQKIYYRNR